MKTRVAISTALLLAACLAGRAIARDRGIHLPEGRKQSFIWNPSDARGFRWDISAHGQVQDGTNDAYDVAMTLHVDGQQWSRSAQGRLSEDGHEVEIGPWNRGDVRVWRRIYIDAGEDGVGYCRWIDIFENTSGKPQTLNVMHFLDMGGPTQFTHTTSGETNLTEEDWAMVTSDNRGRTTRPSMVHVFSSEGAKVRPRVQWSTGSDDIRFQTTVKVPAKRTVALCMIQAQCHSFEEGQAFLAKLDMRRELRKVPPELRSILLNMRGTMLTLGTLELPRRMDTDVVIRADGEEMVGKIVSDRFVLETEGGERAFPAERVMGLKVEEDRVRLGLTDGQVLVGRLTSWPVAFEGEGGERMKLPPKGVTTLAFRISEARPEDVVPTDPLIVLRTGERLAFAGGDFPGKYHTQCGDVDLDPAHLRALMLDTPDGGLHRAVFRNGSILSGLLMSEEIELACKVGRSLRVDRRRVHRFVFPGDITEAPLMELTLNNDDVLRGRIAEKELTVKTPYGTITAVPDKVRSLEIIPDDTLGRVRLRLKSGTSVEGALDKRKIRFEIVPGPVLDVFLGHIRDVAAPEEAEAGASLGAPASPPVAVPAEIEALHLVPAEVGPIRGFGPQ